MSKRIRGSLTVESSLVMPMVLGCVFLIFMMNLYLHDQVVLDSLDTELLCSEVTNKEEAFQSALSERTILLNGVNTEYKESLLKKQLTWSGKMDFSTVGIISFVLPAGKVSLGGSHNTNGWNMTQIMRMKHMVSG